MKTNAKAREGVRELPGLRRYAVMGVGRREHGYPGFVSVAGCSTTTEFEWRLRGGGDRGTVAAGRKGRRGSENGTGELGTLTSEKRVKWPGAAYVRAELHQTCSRFLLLHSHSRRKHVEGPDIPPTDSRAVLTRQGGDCGRGKAGGRMGACGAGGVALGFRQASGGIGSVGRMYVFVEGRLPSGPCSRPLNGYLKAGGLPGRPLEQREM